MVERRAGLRFADLDEAVRDAERLLERGYQRAGNWDLAQCCHHLAVLMDYPIDGFPKFAFPMNAAAWLLKVTIAPRQLRKVIDSGVWPSGTPTDQRTIPESGGDEAAEVGRLKRSVARLQNHSGRLKLQSRKSL